MTPEAEVGLLKAMCHMYSPSGAEGQIAAYLAERMTSFGWNARIDGAGNVVGETGEGPGTIMFLGHMDTVPGFIPVEVREGLLYGRGSVDAKGPLAAFICAVERNAGIRRRVVVVGAVGEETDESPGATYLANHGPAPDFCVIGEPGGWSSVTLGYRGRLAAEAVVRRPVGHTASGRPSVLEMAVELWGEARAWVREWPGGARTFERPSVALKDMRRETDYFHESARISMDFRLPPGLAPSEFGAGLRERFPGAEFQFRGGQPGWREAKDNPLVRAFVNAIREEDGDLGFRLKLGTSDMNVVAPAWGCPIVAYGPGDSSLDHTPGEHLSISEYQSSISILSRVLQTL